MPVTPGTVRRYGSPAKASGGRVRRADGYQRGRQGALRGFGEQFAAQLGRSWHTIQKELDDVARDPIRKAADRVRALRALGASSDRIHLYVLEIMNAVHATPAGADAVETLVSSESCADADEDVTAVRALLSGLAPANCREWADMLRRSAAASLALAESVGGDVVTGQPLHVHRNPASRQGPPRDRTVWLLALCIVALVIIAVVWP